MFTLTILSTSCSPFLILFLLVFLLCSDLGLALWSRPGSSPRISPQRHNYHTGLNVPPTSSGTHQRPFTLQTSSPPILSLGSLSINRMFYSRDHPVLVFFFFFSLIIFFPSRLSWKWCEINAFNFLDGLKKTIGWMRTIDRCLWCIIRWYMSQTITQNSQRSTHSCLCQKKSYQDGLADRLQLLVQPARSLWEVLI